MAAHNVDGKRLFIRQLTKKSTPPSSHPVDESSLSKLPEPTLPPQRPPPITVPSSSVHTTDTLVGHTKVAPTTRIVVVRTTSSTQNEAGEVTEKNETARSKSVELPPVLTNGRTSVYLIRRPIPPPETPRQTKLYQSTDDFDYTELNKTTTNTTTTGNNLHHSRSPTSTEEIETTPNSPSQNQASTRRAKAFKQRSPLTQTESPKLHSNDNRRTESPQVYSPTINDPDTPKRFISSPTQSGNLQQTKDRSRSRSKSRKRNLVRSNSKSRSRSRTRRTSPSRLLPSPPSSSTQEEPKETDPKSSLFSFSRTKSTGVQANLLPAELNENVQRTVQNTQSKIRKKPQRKKSPIPRVKSTKSIVLVNPDDQTIAVIENSYLKGETINPIIQGPKSSKRSRFQPDIDSQSREKLVKTSRWYTCLGCLSRHMCLIIAICLIVILIGLIGIAVSVYFLVTDSQDNLIPKIIGIVIGSILIIVALCFLYCVLACIGSRDGYFSYNDDGPHAGGRAFALIPPTHPNAHLYIPRDYMEMYENNAISSLPSNSINSTHQQQPKTINRQKKIASELSATTSAKNVTIEMPERLLTGRKMSPKTHERKLNKVVNNIGHVVEDAKKRYTDVPTKVIVKVDENAKATV